ncbi:MAG: fumarate hydratase, partial [candidate division KSB1 bacterium]|nr:fumarate hydratase [candidate division KSB1 bacterium]
MREIACSQIVEAVRELCLDANYRLNPSMIRALEDARQREESPAGRKILDHLLENARIAASGENPLCQDTGLVVFFIELGQEVHLVGGRLEDAVNEGVRRAYREGYLRNSVVGDPLRRRNTGDNTPAVIWLDLVPGDRLRIDMAPKGAGSENMSGLAMLKPTQGEEGVIDFVVDWISRAGGNPCPPIVVGVGLGGTFEKAAWLAKKAILREIG